MAIDPRTMPNSPPEDSGIWNVKNFKPSQVLDRVEVGLNNTDRQEEDLASPSRKPYALAIVICSCVFGVVTAIIFLLMGGGLVNSFILYLISSIGLAMAWIAILFITHHFSGLPPNAGK